MKAKNMNNIISKTKLLLAPMVVSVMLLLTVGAQAATPGISGTSFNLSASPAYITQPDGTMVYSWGYGCTDTNGVTFVPAALSVTAACSAMQLPGPTLVVTQGQHITVTLTNSLPSSAGNTSILFPGFNVTASGGVDGLLTKEAAHGSTVKYEFDATTPGTRSYYSGTQGDLQVEMGLYGAIIVLPSSTPGNCAPLNNVPAHYVKPGNQAEKDYRLASAAYNHARACYDREYLFQFSEMDLRIHNETLAQVTALGNCTAGAPGCSLSVATEPYVPSYFMVNGRSMPDDMDSNYSYQYPHQPYNGNPHMHPGEQVLLRIVGQGRWQHPFHEHGNHVRVLARDGNLIVSQSDANSLAGPLLFTTTTTPGQAMDGIFYWTGKGLNWDAYGHNAASGDPLGHPACDGNLNGYHSDPLALNYYEWCQDHNKPLETHPLGDVAGGGPVTLPDPNILTNGAWFGGSPYLGPNATIRAVGSTGTTPPSGTIANPPTEEAAFAYMWHSHNEREITTNNIFPGGMMMMMLVDSREFNIDESN